MRRDTRMPQLFAVPRRLPPIPARVHDYWRGLLRGGATMPFADDVRLTDLPDLAGDMLLVDVVERPERFRFNHVGAQRGGAGLAGRFLDEVDLATPFEFLRSQCSATVEAGRPTWFRWAPDGPAASSTAYSRLLLPLWGEGHVAMLMGITTPD